MKDLLDRVDNKIRKFKEGKRYGEMMQGLCLASAYGLINLGEVWLGIKPNIIKTVQGNLSLESFLWVGLFADNLSSIISAEHHYLATKPFEFFGYVYKKLKSKTK